jgi:hypothetical protein
MTKNKGQKIMEFNFDITELRHFLQDELKIPSAAFALVMQKKRGIECTHTNATVAIWFRLLSGIRTHF